MITSLYRLRPVENLLCKYNELQNQEVYFADPGELNDPMEGFRELFWHGDEIVWTNLFKHYLRCLDKAWALLSLYGDEKPFGWDNIPIFHLADPSPTPQHKAMLDEIFSDFFSNNVVISLITDLAGRDLPVRRHELSAYIRCFHQLAIVVISKCHARHQISANMLKPELCGQARKQAAEAIKISTAIKKVTATCPNAEAAVDGLFLSHEFLNDQMMFINQYNGPVDPNQANRMFVFIDFCCEYVRKLERLVYPDWYAACFMADCRNASIWGSYGKNQTGACLKFKVAIANGRPFIRLNRIAGWTSSGSFNGDLDHEFLKVDYDTQHVAVNFFRSLACQPIPIVREYWYSDGKGGRSPCADPLSSDGGAWRKRYWSEFKKSISIKLADWKSEQEYRLFLTGDWLDLSEKAARKARYDFNDLEGIIFGMNTASDKKREVCQIIEEKCRKSGRMDFKFYQAFYSREKRIIDYAEMGLVKFKP